MNHPLKALMRRQRSGQLYDYFQNFRIKYMEEQAKPAGTRRFPAFLPPKPTLAQVLQGLFSARTELYDTERFKRGLASAFVRASLWYLHEEAGAFSIYTGHERTAAPVSRAGVAAHAVVYQLGDSLDDVELTTRVAAEAEAEAAEADAAPFEPGIGTAVASARRGAVVKAAREAVERAAALAARLDGERVAEESCKAAAEVRRMRLLLTSNEGTKNGSAAFRAPPPQFNELAQPLGRRAPASAYPDAASLAAAARGAAIVQRIAPVDTRPDAVPSRVVAPMSYDESDI